MTPIAEAAEKHARNWTKPPLPDEAQDALRHAFLKGVEWQRSAAGPATREQEEATKLRAFKEYVHKRLDDAGIPHDPEAEKNKAHGCRIEGRLNFVLARKEQGSERECIRDGEKMISQMRIAHERTIEDRNALVDALKDIISFHDKWGGATDVRKIAFDAIARSEIGVANG